MSDWSTTRRRHGTHSGWTLHIQLRERPCDPCYQAKQAYDAERRANPGLNAQNRLAARAQGRAYGALAHRYPDEYRELYQQFKDELLSESSA